VQLTRLKKLIAQQPQYQNQWTWMSAAKIFSVDASFWWYNVYADICVGSHFVCKYSL